MKVRYSKRRGIKWCGIFIAVLQLWMIIGHDDVSVAQVQSGNRRFENISKIDGGYGHSIALKSDGSVVCWGYNVYNITNTPEQAQSGVVSVAAGSGHSLALKIDGTVLAWGINAYGECDVPEGLDDVIAITSGRYHSLALKSDGTVVAWGGGNSSGQCNVPDGLNGVVDIAAGEAHSLALKADGTVVGWGEDCYGQATVPTEAQGSVVAIAAGEMYSLALKSDGTVAAWGNNTNGQCTVPTGLNGVVSIAAGGYHALALKSDGTIVAWGANGSGQSTVPAGLNDIVAIAGASSHSMALKSDGTVVAWGNNEYGKAEVPEGLSVPVKGKAISAGDYHSLALKSDGSVVAWGNDEFGQSTVPVEAQNNMVAIAAGEIHSLALKSDGTVVAWGNNSNGECTAPAGLSGVVAISAGLGRSLALKADGTVTGWGSYGGGESLVIESLRGVTAISVGGGHSLALKSDGTVVAWGRNDILQTWVPSSLSGVVAISAGYEHSLALKSDGTVVAWGSNSNGQRTVPLGLNGVVAIEAGAMHSLALKSDGTVVSWGALDQSTVPEDLNGVLAISGGGGYTLALKADGTIAAWGDNSFGKATVPNSGDLSGLTIDLGDLSPSPFDTSVTEYTFRYAGASVTSVNISGTLDNPDEAELYIYGQKRESGAAVTVPLNETSTDIIVGVKSCFLPEKIYTVTVYRDMNAPTVVFGTNGSEAYTDAAASTVTVSDEVSGVDASSFEYAWTTGTGIPESGWTSFTSGDTLTKSGADGDWYLHIKAADMAGNITNIVSNRFRLDSAAPSASLISPTGTSAAISASNIVLSFSESVIGAEGGEITISDGSNTYTCTIGASEDYITEIESVYRAVIPVSSFLYNGEPLVLNYDTTYTVAAEAGAYVDVAGKETAAGNVGSFKTEMVPPSDVTVSANPIAGGLVSGGGTYSEGNSVTVTATTGSGFVFVNWTEEGTEVSTCASYTFIMGISDRDLVANFAAVPITLESIEITTLPVKLIYTVGESLDISGMVVTGAYSDGSTRAETVTTADVNGFDSTTPAAIQVLTVTVGSKTDTYTVTINSPPDTVVNLAAISGVAVPANGAEPVTTIAETAQYTGTIEWNPAHDLFAANTEYTAIITLTPKAGYTLNGVEENFFIVAGTTSVSNSADSGVITAVFPATAAPRNASIFPATDGFDRNSDNQDDVHTTITWGDASVIIDVKAEGSSIGADNYSVSDDTLTIKKEYLAAQATGGLPLTVEFNVGVAATLTITVIDTTPPFISPASHHYDLNTPADVTTVVTWNSAVSVTNAVCRVSPDTTLYPLDTDDYTVVDNELTIKNSFFSGLSLTTGATIEFDITFNTGAASTLTVNVVNSYTPSDDADLNNLLVNGTPVSDFDADDTEYDVELPFGTSSATITATASDVNAQVSITQVSVLPGSATVTVTAEDGTTIKTYIINLTIGVPPTTYTVTFSSNGSVHATKTVNAGEDVGNAAWPADPTRNSYTFGGWFTGENGTGTQFTSEMPVNAAITFYAKWTYSGGSGGGSSSGGGNTTPATPNLNAEVNTGSGSSSTKPVIVDKNGVNASVDLGSGNSLISEGKTTVIAVPPVPDIDTYTLVIPVPSLSTQDEQGTLSFKTDIGTVTIPSNMLTGVKFPDGSLEISESNAEISIGQCDKSGLPAEAKAAIGDRPVISLSLSIDGKQTDWNNPSAPVTVNIPYTPTAAELANPESIVVWYIDGSGNAVSVPNGRYDAATGTVSFTTTHFSNYAVVYNKVSFTDVADTAWYSDAVGFISARGITTGTGNGKFNPDAKLTRGEFMVMMMRAYGIAPDESLADNFSDAGSTYYSGYLAAAKQLEISVGVGNNLFAPSKEITRQEMFTLLYNALKVIGQLPEGTMLPERSSGKALSDFSDADDIASWAKDSMTLLVKTGTVGGSGGKLNPASTTTRAEMALVLYNLFKK